MQHAVRNRQVWLQAICLFWLITSLLPLLWLVQLSLKTSGEAISGRSGFFFTPTLQNYTDLLRATDFPRFLVNSLLIGLGTTVLSLLLGVPAAYAFSRWTFRGSGLMMLWVLAVRMVPGLAYIIPVFVIYQRLGLLDTRLGLILIYTVFNLALVVWSMQAFFDEVPRSLEESAYVDGASILRGFLQIVLPLSAPGLVATAVLCFLFSWNEFLLALVLSRFEARTAPVGITNFMAYEGIEWGRVAAGSVFVLIPVLLFTAVMRKYLVRGLLGGALKG